MLAIVLLLRKICSILRSWSSLDFVCCNLELLNELLFIAVDTINAILKNQCTNSELIIGHRFILIVWGGSLSSRMLFVCKMEGILQAKGML